MSLNDFLSAPWKKTHEVYEDSVFNIRPAPEFATAEVLLASTYRASGYSGHPESSVPAAGRTLDKASTKARGAKSGTVSSDTWHVILHGTLQSPKQPNQSVRRFLQLCPMVPAVALYSGSARLAGSSWNPGQLIQRMIQLGCRSQAEAQRVWSDLHAALSVHDDDDIWARWLDAEFGKRKAAGLPDWAAAHISDTPTLPDEEKRGLRTPAAQFVRDLAATIRAKRCMTRRQWISLMEAVLRLGAVSHVLWLCDVNDTIWRAVRSVLDGHAPPSAQQLSALIASSRDNALVYGRPAIPIVRDLASRYLSSRLGLNLLLWNLSALGVTPGSLASIHDTAAFIEIVANRKEQLTSWLPTYRRLGDQEARTIACMKGIGSNLVEFCRHTLGQRQTADDNLRGYDQGYQLRKKGDYRSAPWVVALGPVSLLAMVHCCLDEVSGPRSVHRLCEHLSWYGLKVDMDNIANSDLGRELRLLGLILDSPDAESGMLLVPPFDMSDLGGAR